MQQESIKVIFTNFLFVIGVLLMVVGFILGTNAIINSFAFDKYPLEEWMETRCTIDMAYSDPVLPPGDSSTYNTQTDTNKLRQECQDNLDLTRQYRQIKDMSNAVAFLIAGIILSISFRRFIIIK